MRVSSASQTAGKDVLALECHWVKDLNESWAAFLDERDCPALPVVLISLQVTRVSWLFMALEIEHERL